MPALRTGVPTRPISTSSPEYASGTGLGRRHEGGQWRWIERRTHVADRLPLLVGEGRTRARVLGVQRFERGTTLIGQRVIGEQRQGLRECIVLRHAIEQVDQPLGT